MNKSYTRYIVWRLLITGLLVALCSACVPITATKIVTEARTTDSNIGMDDTSRTINVKPVPFIEFGLDRMTDERAKTIAETAGFKYIGWRPCSGNLQHCAVFKVQGQRGNIFEYHVADQRCSAYQLGESQQRPLDLDRPYASQARIFKPKPASGDVFKPIFDQAMSAPEEGKATDCFAGFTAMLRVRQENSYISDNTGYILVTEHIYQVLDDKRWTDTITVLNNMWRVPVSGTGMTNEGYSYEFLDSTGTSLAEDSFEYNMIASSGSSAEGPSLVERCEIQMNAYQSKLEAAVLVSYAACETIAMVVPDCGTIEVVFEPVNIGGSVSLSKCTETCEIGRDTALGVAKAAGAGMNADCVENPGRYFPADYPPVPDDFVLEDDVFKPMTYDTIVLEGDSCPSFKTVEYGFSLAGMDCTVKEPQICEKNNKGECTCQLDQRIGSNVETICTQ